MSWVLHTYALVRSCILDANTSCISHWLCVGHAIDFYVALNCITCPEDHLLVKCYCSHSLMTVLVWSSYAYMFYSVYKLYRILLAYVRTMYSTCHKRNESFVCVQVFQVIGIYVQVLHNFYIRCEWVLPLFPNSHLSLKSVLGVFFHRIVKGRDCKVVIYNYMFCWL